VESGFCARAIAAVAVLNTNTVTQADFVKRSNRTMARVVEAW